MYVVICLQVNLFIYLFIYFMTLIFFTHGMPKTVKNVAYLNWGPAYCIWDMNIKTKTNHPDTTWTNRSKKLKMTWIN